MSNQDTSNKIEKWNYVAWTGCLGVFLSGFIEPSLWIFGPIYVSLPLLLLCGSIFLYNRKTIKNEEVRHRMGVALALLLFEVGFVFFVMTNMSFPMMG